MFDSDTLTVTYDLKRGEPRGSRGRKVDPRAAGLGDCVDCSICVQVCPVGIDIRDGLQYECIGCAACIDSCDQVMDKMGYPRGLIRYTTENALLGNTPEAATGFGKVTARLFRPRIIIYSVILGGVATALAASLYLRVPLKVNVLRDRATLVRDAGDGRIENVYRLQITNTVERPRSYSIVAQGLEGQQAMEVVLESDGHGSPSTAADIDAASTRMVPLRVRADPAGMAAGSHPITFVVTATDDPAVNTTEKSIFFSR